MEGARAGEGGREGDGLGEKKRDRRARKRGVGQRKGLCGSCTEEGIEVKKWKLDEAQGQRGQWTRGGAGEGGRKEEMSS